MSVLSFFLVPAISQHRLEIGIDRDNNVATGCSLLATQQGVSETVDGFELLLEVSIEAGVTSPQVLGIQVSQCDSMSNSFGAATPVSPGGFPVGLNNGLSGADVIEAFLPGSGFLANSSVVRLLVQFDSQFGGRDTAGASVDDPIVVFQQTVDIEGIPTLSQIGLWFLALLLAAASVCLLRRRGAGTAALLLAILTAATAGATLYAALGSADGQIGDWVGVNPFIDPSGDSTLDDPTADIIGVFVRFDSVQLCLRVDVAEQQNNPPEVQDDVAVTDEETPIDIDVLSNDSDADPTDSVHTFNSQEGDQGAATSVNPDGTIRYSPAPDFEGVETFTYEARDENGATSTGTVTVTVNGLPDPPEAVDDLANTAQDTAVLIAALANDRDPDAGDVLTIIGVADPPNGTAVVNGDQINYTPDGGFLGSDTFSYSIEDSTGNTDNADITVNVSAAPGMFVDDTASTDEDSPVAVNVLDNDSGDSLAVTAVTQGSNGSAVINADNTVTYTPEPGFTGVDSFTYTALSQTTNDTGTPTVNVTVNAVNEAPEAVNDVAAAVEGEPRRIEVLSNDVDPDGDNLTVEAVTDPISGTVQINGDDSITYTSGDDFTGQDTFSYTIEDPSGEGDTATVTVLVFGAAELPVAVDDLAVTDEGMPVDINVLANDNLPDDDDPVMLMIQSVTQPASGTASIVGNMVRYTPEPFFNGMVMFNYTALVSGDDDGEDFNALTAKVTVTVNPVPTPPGTIDDISATDEDMAVDIDVASNDSDPDSGGAPMLISVTPGANGSTSVVGGVARYAPNANFNGVDMFSYTVRGAGGLDSTGKVTVTVNAINDSPTAVDDAFTVDRDEVLAGDVLAANPTDPDSDVESDPLTVSQVNGNAANVGMQFALAKGGLLTLDSDGSFTYDPNGQFNGLAPGETDTETFTYRISDGNGGFDDATATITVVGVNDPPVAVDDALSTGEDVPLAGDVLAANPTTPDSDPNSDPLTVIEVNGSAANVGFQIAAAGGGLVTVNANGTFGFDPAGDFNGLAVGMNGLASFTYTISDGAGGTDTATVNITVTGSNDTPTAVSDAVSTDEDTLLNGDVLAANPTTPDSDPDSDPLTVTEVDGNPANVGVQITLAKGGLLTVNANGAFSYDPNGQFEALGAGASDSETFTYRIIDGNGGTDTATVTITIDGINDPPMLVDGEDVFATLGNTQLAAGVIDADLSSFVGFAFVTDSENVLQKGIDDSDPEGGNLAVERAGANAGSLTDIGPGTSIATSMGGSVRFDADGHFLYTPPAGAAGVSDTFLYEVCDDDVPKACSTATVEVALAAERVWFVKNDAVGGDGTSSSPFGLLNDGVDDPVDNDAQEASGDGDIIFVFEGDGTSAGQNQGITLKNGQKLIGHSTSTHVLAANTVQTPNPPSSTPMPASDMPRIEHLAGNGVDIDATAGDRTNVEIRNLDISGSANAVDVTSGAAHQVSVTITDNFIRGSGSEGIDLNPDGSGSFQVTAVNNDFATASPTGNAFDLTTGVTSNNPVTVAFSGNTNITSASGNGVNIDGALGGGSVTITAFANNSVDGNTGGTGIFVGQATFDPTPGGVFEQVAGGNTIIGTMANPVGGKGMDLVNVSGDLSFTALVIHSMGTGLDVQGSGFFAAGPPTGSGFQLGTDPTGSSVTAAAGAALNLDPFTAALRFDSLASTNSSTRGVFIDSVGGLLTVSGLTDIDTPSGNGVEIANSPGAFTFNTIDVDGAGGNALDFNSFSGTFDATSAVAIDGQGATAIGVDISNSSGSIDFNSLTLDNTTGDGINFEGNTTSTLIVSGGAIGAINDPGGQAVDIDQGTGNVSIAASITKNSLGDAVEVTQRGGGSVTVSGSIACNSGCTGLNLANNTGGSTSFTNAAKTVATGTDPAVTLTSNTGHTINFTGGGLDIDTTSGAGFTATGGGTVNVAGAGNSITTVETSGGANNAGAAVVLSGVTLGASDVSFDTISSTNVAPATTALSFNSVSNAGTFFGGTLTITEGSDGVSINGSSAAFNFTSATIDNTVNEGIDLSGANGTVTFASIDVDGTGGVGLAVAGNTNPVNINGGSIGSTTSTSGDAVRVTGGGGDVNVAAAITNSAGNAAEVTGKTGGTVAFSGAIIDTGGGVFLNNNSGAALQFTGGVDLDTGSNTAFTATGGGSVTWTAGTNTIDTVAGVALLVDNTALDAVLQNINVTAGTSDGVMITNSTGSKTFNSVRITNNGGTGFLASSAGTLTIPAAGLNTINTVASAAGDFGLNISNTTIASAGVTFRSVSVNGSSTVQRGIVLNNTGTASNSFFEITGVGATNGSGGTVQNILQRGAELIGVQDLRLNNMAFTNANGINGDNPADTGGTCSELRSTSNLGCNAGIYLRSLTEATIFDNVDVSGAVQHGINANAVANLTVQNSGITSNGNETQENGLNLMNLSGTSNFTNNTVTSNHFHGLNIGHDTGAAVVNVSGGTYSNQTLAHGFNCESFANNSASLTTLVTGALFDNNLGSGIDAFSFGNTTLNSTIGGAAMADRNTFTDNDNSINIQSQDAALHNFNVRNNRGLVKTSISTSNINVFQGASTNTGTRLSGSIIDNEVGDPGIARSGSQGGFGIRIDVNSNGTTTVLIDGNVVRSVDQDSGIFLAAGDGDGRLNATVRNNDVNLASVNAFFPLDINSGTSTRTDSSIVCVVVEGNNAFATASGDEDVGLRVISDNPDVAQILLPGYAGGATDLTAVEAFMTAITGVDTADARRIGNSGIYQTGSCPLP